MVYRSTILNIMIKLLPYETPTVYYFEVVIVDPSNSNISFVRNIYSYIQDIDVIAAIVDYSTKYDYTLRYLGTEPTLPRSQHLSLNQAVALLQRLRFYTRKTVEKQRIVTYTEVIEEEL